MSHFFLSLHEIVALHVQNNARCVFIRVVHVSFICVCVHVHVFYSGNLLNKCWVCIHVFNWITYAYSLNVCKFRHECLHGFFPLCGSTIRPVSAPGLIRLDNFSRLSAAYLRYVRVSFIISHHAIVLLVLYNFFFLTRRRILLDTCFIRWRFLRLIFFVVGEFPIFRVFIYWEVVNCKWFLLHFIDDISSKMLFSLLLFFALLLYCSTCQKIYHGIIDSMRIISWRLHSTPRPRPPNWFLTIGEMLDIRFFCGIQFKKSRIVGDFHQVDLISDYTSCRYWSSRKNRVGVQRKKHEFLTHKKKIRGRVKFVIRRMTMYIFSFCYRTGHWPAIHNLAKCSVSNNISAKGFLPELLSLCR